MPGTSLRTQDQLSNRVPTPRGGCRKSPLAPARGRGLGRGGSLNMLFLLSKPSFQTPLPQGEDFLRHLLRLTGTGLP